MRRFILWGIILAVIGNIVLTWGTESVFGWLVAMAAWCHLLMGEYTQS